MQNLDYFWCTTSDGPGLVPAAAEAEYYAHLPTAPPTWDSELSVKQNQKIKILSGMIVLSSGRARALAIYFTHTYIMSILTWTAYYFGSSLSSHHPFASNPLASFEKENLCLSKRKIYSQNQKSCVFSMDTVSTGSFLLSKVKFLVGQETWVQFITLLCGSMSCYWIIHLKPYPKWTKPPRLHFAGPHFDPISTFWKVTMVGNYGGSRSRCANSIFEILVSSRHVKRW